MCGVFGVVLPGRRADRCRVDRGARPVRAPAPRPGVGRSGGQRRRAADALQGPRDDQHGPRRAPPAEPARPARDRPLPLLDDRLDHLGERPADVPPRAAPGARDRPQRQPRQHPRPARAAPGRPRPPAGVDRHGAADRAPRRRAGRRHGRGAPPGPAARPRRVQPRRPRRAAGHRRPRPVRLPAARPRAAAGRRTPATTTACGTATTRRPAGACRPRRPRSTSSAPNTSATSSPARWSSSSPASRRARSASPRRRPRCASSSSSTSPGPTRTWRAATCTRPGARWACSSRWSTRSTPTS